MKLNFDLKKEALTNQFETPNWIAQSGMTTEELEPLVLELERTYCSKAIIKAKTFELIATKGRIAIDRDDIFQDKLAGGGIMVAQRTRWENEVKERFLSAETAEIKRAWKEFGAYNGMSDYGHTSPNTRLMLSVGFTGLLERVEAAAQKSDLTEHQKEFYASCQTVLRAVIHVAKRLAEAIKPYNEENANALLRIASAPPQNSYEAMQMLILYFFLHEYIAGTRVRTLGRLDVLLYPFYQKDIADGTYTKADIKEMLKHFLYKFWVAKVPFDLPFCLGGTDENGDEVTSDISYLIVQTYNELNIHSPKIHIRVSEKTPQDFVTLVLSCIRGGNSSFVFINDAIGIETLIRVGIEERDARDFVPIGCYEPAVWGVEIGCTGNGGVNLAKAMELVLTNGRDQKSGCLCGVETGKIDDFEALVDAVKKQIAYMTERAVTYITQIEGYYRETNPDPLLSCQYEHSVETGVDVYEGGAKYNNSSIYLYSLASLIDSLFAVKKLVFDDGKYTLEELAEILKNNWQGHEQDRAIVLHLTEKYGNNIPEVDALAVELADFCAKLLNNKPNGRGGVFKAALFSIDHCFYIGARTMATPDGRLAGDPLSKNMCATPAMDRNGVTALINSVTKIDHVAFPTGSVLDIVLHPSAVAGEDGLTAFYGILMTYLQKGGFALQGNVFCADDLKKAQKDPDSYRNLQVRVCGWNAYFVNLSKAEQDAFIRQAECQG